MCHLENTIFENSPQLKPPVYCRYIDDIFLVIDNYNQLSLLKDAFKENSLLNFTFETEQRKQIPFPGYYSEKNRKKIRNHSIQKKY